MVTPHFRQLKLKYKKMWLSGYQDQDIQNKFMIINLYWPILINKSNIIEYNPWTCFYLFYSIDLNDLGYFNKNIRGHQRK